MILSALNEQVDFYKTPQQIKPAQLIGERLRIGGYVMKDSVRRVDNVIYFTVTDFSKNIEIAYEGILPDLFREGQGIIVEGVLESPHLFRAAMIFAKHDENYRPPDLPLKPETLTMPKMPDMPETLNMPKTPDMPEMIKR